MLEILAVAALLLLLLSFVVYPFVLALLAKCAPGSQTVQPDAPVWPRVSLVIACYNEEQHIEEKLLNALALDYPQERLEILVFSDGSTDRTDAIVEGYASRGVRLVRVEGRLGKTHCQNELAQVARGEVLVFSDANTMYSAGALRALVRALSPEHIGVAIGKRVYVGRGKPGNQEGLYERLENWIKASESRLGGTIGANGSMYALKAKYYVELPIDRMSDIVEPLRVNAEHGKITVYAGDAVGREEHDNDFRTEFKRKRRIVLRAMNSLWAERRRLAGRPGLLLKLLLHKVIRWFTLPLMLLLATASVAAQSGVMMWAGYAALAYLVAAAALFAWAWSVHGGRPPALGRVGGLLLYSFGVFLGAGLALIDFLRGRNIRVWESRS